MCKARHISSLIAGIIALLVGLFITLMMGITFIEVAPERPLIQFIILIIWLVLGARMIMRFIFDVALRLIIDSCRNLLGRKPVD